MVLVGLGRLDRGRAAALASSAVLGGVVVLVVGGILDVVVRCRGSSSSTRSVSSTSRSSRARCPGRRWSLSSSVTSSGLPATAFAAFLAGAFLGRGALGGGAALGLGRGALGRPLGRGLLGGRLAERCASAGSSVAGLAFVAATYTSSVSAKFSAGMGILHRKRRLSNVGVLIGWIFTAIRQAAAEDHCNDSAGVHRAERQISARRPTESAQVTPAVACVPVGPDSSLAMAAPTMPAVLSSAAGTTGCGFFSSGSHLVGLAADAAARDEQVRPDRVLDGHQNLVHLLAPPRVTPPCGP